MSLRCGVGWGRCRVLVPSAPLREILQTIHQRSSNADEPDLKRGTWAKKGDSHRFSRRTSVGNKGIPQARIAWRSPIFARAHFCHGLLGQMLRVRVADPSLAAGALKGSLANEAENLSLRKR